MQTRVTLREVAAKAGVHHTTASRALKNDPRVCPATLKKIRAIAEQMGYMPDPMLSALNAYRHASRSAQDHGTIAWITNYPTRDGWRGSSCYMLYFQGAAERLSKLGYRLEEFWLQEPGMTARRSSQVLFHRGIRGLLICPLPVSRGHLSLRWEMFSAVSFGYSLLRPSLHLLSTSHYRGLITCMRKLRALGYRRIGMVTSHEMDERMDRMWTASYRTEIHTASPRGRAFPIYFYSHIEESASVASRKEHKKRFMKWFLDHKPDAIVTSASPVASWLTDEGYNVPGDVAVVSATLQEGEPYYSGIIEPSREIGRAAADFVVRMLQHGEYGIPAIPQRVLLEGKWTSGKTTGKGNQSILPSPG